LSYIHTCSTSAAITTGYIHTHSSSAVNIVNLRSYALQNLVGTNCYPTLVHAARLPSTLLTCIRTHCRTSLVPAAVLRSYALLVCCQDRRPVLVLVAAPRWQPLLSYIRICYASAAITTNNIRKCTSSAVNIVVLCPYMLQSFIGTHSCPSFVRAARIQSTSLTCTCTCCRTSLVPTVFLHSYMQRVCHHYRWLHSYTLLVSCQHRQPAFVPVAEPCWYPLLSYISMCCSSAVNIVDLHSYALQNLLGTHCFPMFVRAARLPSTSST